jgi:DNA helicase-2/ATP-dependent DNA helicase PcrA
VLVVAGAGSGKTRTLAYRVAYLLAAGADPGRILLLTFTRRSAEEMLRRADAIVRRGAHSVARVWGGTFHATANRLLRIYAKAVGLSRDFTVMDEGDAEDMLNVIRHDMGLHAKEMRFPQKSTCRAIYSRCVNGRSDLNFVLKRHFPWCEAWEHELKALFQKYVARKQERHVLDYDDLLLYWAHLVGDERMGREVGGRFTHILVDEYQDTNPLQADILRGMSAGGCDVMAVGDDAQSIYGFRAATVRNMLDFPKQFPNAAVVTLEQNYRSVMPILETTNLIIAQSRERFTKDLWSDRRVGQRPRLVTCRDEPQQDDYVIRRILEHREEGIPLRRQAVLFRTGHHSDTLEVELTRRNIPYHKYGGLRFLEAAHVKDLIAFLRIVENPRDEMAWFRALQLMDGIGPSTAARIIRFVDEHGNDPRCLRDFQPPPAAQALLPNFAALMGDLTAAGATNPAPQVERIRKFYDPILQKRYENPVVRARDLESLEQIASGYRSRRKFLVDLQLDPPSSTSDLAGPPNLDEDWLVLSTIHSAKGCEWDAVYVIHAADGCLPSDMATGSEEEIEEELRLTYVAMTRARDFLYVTWPLRYYRKWLKHDDLHAYAQLSRFFTPAVRDCMELVHITGEWADADDRASDMEDRRDAPRRVRDMWD